MIREVDCVTRDVPVKEVAAILSRQPCGGVIVVDEECRPIGVVSEAELAGAVQDEPGRDGAEVSATVDDIMVPIFPLSANLPIAKAEALMAFDHKAFLPVVASTGELIGLLLARDLRPEAPTKTE